MPDCSHLTRLPPEIIQKVASSLPAKTILSLSQTCRYLRIACRDLAVLQDSFLAHIDHPSNTTVLPNKEALRNLISAQLATATGNGTGRPPSESPSAQATLTDAAVWTHLAFAASCLCPPTPDLVNTLETLLAPFESIPWDNSSPPAAPLPAALVNLVGALATFTVLGLPVLVTPDFNAAAALSGLAVRLSHGPFWRAQDPTHRGVLAVQAALCLATGALAHPVLNNMPLLTERVAQAFGFGGTRPSFSSAADADESVITNEWCLSLEGGQTIALLAMACAVRLLRLDTAVQARDDFPRLAGVPFLNRIQAGTGTVPIPVSLPLPEGSVGTGVLGADSPGTALRAFGVVAGPGYARWMRENLNAMIEDLPNGEWVGYYTYAAEVNQADDPLRDIYFTTEPDPDDGDGVLVKAEGGMDGVGRFDLDGKISRRAGWVSLRKTYVQAGFEWANQAWLTPLGIAGYWGEQPGSGSGFIWMYKKEWTREGATKEVPLG